MNKDYFNTQAISSSLLVALSDHPKKAKAFLEGDKKETTAMSLGSLVDMKLTQPDKIGETYYVGVENTPTDKMLTMAELFIRSKHAGIEGEDKELLLQVRNAVEYDRRLTPDKVWERFKEKAYDYCLERIAAEKRGKIFIDIDTDMVADCLVDDVKTSKVRGWMFRGDLDKSRYEILFQVPIYFEYKGEKCKALLDWIIIDHVEKIVTPEDLKTYDGKFMSNFYRFKYYYQASWYTFATAKLMVQRKLDGYRLNPLNFVTVDTSGFREVEVYTVSKELSCELMEEKPSETIKSKPTIPMLIEEYKMRKSRDEWSHSIEILEKGRIMIEEL